MSKIYYGYQSEIPKNFQRSATLQEAYKKGQLRRYGLIKIDSAKLNKIIDQTKIIAVKLKEEIIKNKKKSNKYHTTNYKIYKIKSKRDSTIEYKNIKEQIIDDVKYICSPDKDNIKNLQQSLYYAYLISKELTKISRKYNIKAKLSPNEILTITKDTQKLKLFFDYVYNLAIYRASKFEENILTRWATPDWYITPKEEVKLFMNEILKHIKPIEEDYTQEINKVVKQHKIKEIQEHELQKKIKEKKPNKQFQEKVKKKNLLLDFYKIISKKDMKGILKFKHN